MNHTVSKLRVIIIVSVFSIIFFGIAGGAFAAISLQPAQGPLTGVNSGYPAYPDLQFYSPTPPTSYGPVYNYGCEMMVVGDVVACHKMYPIENPNDKYNCGTASPSNPLNLGSAWLFNNCGSTGDLIPPSPNPIVTLTPVSATQITVSWTPSTDNVGVSYYKVFRFQGVCCNPTPILPNIDVPAPQTTYAHTGLSSGTSYGYYVLAYDAAGNFSGSSGTVYAVTFSDSIPPSIPGNLAATAAGTTQINLTWNPSADTGGSGLAGYRIERCTGATCTNFTEITTVSVPGFSNTGLAPSTTYRYRVRAYDGADNRSDYSNIDSDTTWSPPDITPPTPAPFLTGNANSSTQIGLTWTASTDPESGIASYRVYRNSALIITLGGAVLGYTDGSLLPSTTYTYQVYAVNGAGSATGSNTVSVSTPATPDITPPSFTFTSPGSMLPSGTTSATLGGSTDESATCRYSTTIGTAFASMTLFLTTGTTNHSQPLSGLTDGTLYTYYVKCRDGAGNTNMTDFSYMFQVSAPLPDTTPPIISKTSPLTAVLPANTASVVMSVTTDDDAYCRYSQTMNIPFLSMADVFNNSADLKSHFITLTGLTNGSSYQYFVRCQNTPDGYENMSDFGISFSVAFPANMNPLALLVVSPSTSGASPFTISADGSGSYDSDGTIAQYTWNWGDSSPNTLGVPNASHTYASAGTYVLSLTVRDNQGGFGTASQTISVSAPIVPPPPPPVVSVCTAACTSDSDCAFPNICGPSKFCIAQGGGAGPNRFDGYLSRTDGSMSQPSPATFPSGTASVIMSVKTDVNADCQYSTFSGTPYGASVMKTFSNTGATAHSVTLTGFSSVNTIATYDYYIRCRDLANNMANDIDYPISFTTNAPSVVSGPDPYMCIINPNFIRNNIPYLFDICIPKP